MLIAHAAECQHLVQAYQLIICVDLTATTNQYTLFQAAPCSQRVELLEILGEALYSMTQFMIPVQDGTASLKHCPCRFSGTTLCRIKQQLFDTFHQECWWLVILYLVRLCVCVLITSIDTSSSFVCCRPSNADLKHRLLLYRQGSRCGFSLLKSCKLLSSSMIANHAVLRCNIGTLYMNWTTWQ